MFNETQQAFYIPGSLITICILFLACLYFMAQISKWMQISEKYRKLLVKYATNRKYIKQQIVLTEQQSEIVYFKTRLRLMETFIRYLQGDHTTSYWIWQPEGDNHPESMVSDLTVIIQAEDLRQLLQENP